MAANKPETNQDQPEQKTEVTALPSTEVELLQSVLVEQQKTNELLTRFLEHNKISAESSRFFH